jgi:phage-related protein
MPSIGKGVHELRLKDRSGVYRVIYFLAGASQIWLLHAFKKTTQTTSKQDIEIAKDRLKRTL